MPVYIVITIIGGTIRDVELLSEKPTWDWKALHQVVRLGNINGGDSTEVIA